MAERVIGQNLHVLANIYGNGDVSARPLGSTSGGRVFGDDVYAGPNGGLHLMTATFMGSVSTLFDIVPDTFPSPTEVWVVVNGVTVQRYSTADGSIDVDVPVTVNDGLTVVSLANLSRGVALTGVLTPPTAPGTGTTNNWAPTGMGLANVIRQQLSGIAPLTRTVTGLVPGFNGQVVALVNISGVASMAIVLKAEDAGSSAANRFGIPADITLRGAGGSVILWYDPTSTRWRVIGGNP